MKKCKYPTKIENDFTQTQIQTAKMILSQPPKKICQNLNELLSEHKNSDLVCILRHLLDSEFTEQSISIIGWFFINSMIPTPLCFLFLKTMSAQLNAPNGFELNYTFSRAILPKLYKFGIYCKSLLSHPKIQYYDREYYILINQFSQGQLNLDYYDTRMHFFIPKSHKFFPKLTYHEPIIPLPSHDHVIPLKQNLFSSIEFARSLPPEQQRLYCVNICLTYPPSITRFKFPPFLAAICSYLKLLLYDSKKIAWDAYEIHPQLERLGNWIGSITTGQGRPPPLHMLNIPLLIRNSVQDGTLCHALVFLIAFYNRVAEMLRPPNPITTLVLEILASVLKTPGIRTDIIEKINFFGELLKVDVSQFKNRDIIIPENSFDRYAQFSTDSGSTLFQPASKLKKGDECDIQFCLNAYFHYVPNNEMLPPEQQEIFRTTQKIEKYFFVESKSHIFTQGHDNSEQEMLQCIVSLAIADSPILARTASRLFKKITKGMPPLDLAPIFRCAFPNKYILSASLSRRCFSPTEINSLFSELLTNPYTSPIAKSIISEFMPLCFELYPDYSFASIRELTGWTQKGKKQRTIPLPNSSHVHVLRAFLNFSRTNDYSNRSEFTAKMGNSSISHIISLISFVFAATVKRNSPRTDTSIDYSAIDSLCYALGKCSGRIDNGTLILNCFQAIENIADVSIDQQPKALFRLVNGLFSNLHFRSKLHIIELLEFLAPSRFPSFALCWMQLVMHRAVFPNFVKTNELKSMQFCLNFVITCIKLCVNFPEIFYRGVTRILMTISSVNPIFLISYHMLIIEHIPLNFVQLRNIILSSSTNQNISPPYGFEYYEALNSKTLTPLLESIFQKRKYDQNVYKNIASILKQSINQQILDSKSKSITMPRVVWQFIFYIILKSTDSITEMKATDFSENLPGVITICKVFNFFNDEMALFIIEALIDHLRYQNNHTAFITFLLMSLFNECSSSNKELILVALIKRMMCVTRPPKSVYSVFTAIANKYENKIKEIFADNDELDIYKMAKSIINNTGMKTSSSGRIIVEFETETL